MGKTTCAEPNCNRQAMMFIERKTATNRRLTYCSVLCANQDFSRRENDTESEQTERSTVEGHGETYQASSQRKLSTDYESSAVITVNDHELDPENDTDKILSSIGKPSDKDAGEESNESESWTELAPLSNEENQTHVVPSGQSQRLLDEAKSQSLNLIDDSVRSLHGLMISVRDNIIQKNKGTNHPHVDPAQVNSAANCAREMGNLMKIKIQLLKEQR